MSKENFKKLSETFHEKNQKLSLIEFLKTMIEIVKQPKCLLRFVKNLLELFGNIDVDGNLILEWDELLLYILENRKLLDERLIEGISDEDKLELFHSYKSNFQVRLVKRKALFIGRQVASSLGVFGEKRGQQTLCLMNPKTCRLEVFVNTYQKPEVVE